MVQMVRKKKIQGLKLLFYTSLPRYIDVNNAYVSRFYSWALRVYEAKVKPYFYLVYSIVYITKRGRIPGSRPFMFFFFKLSFIFFLNLFIFFNFILQYSIHFQLVFKFVLIYFLWGYCNLQQISQYLLDVQFYECLFLLLYH